MKNFSREYHEAPLKDWMVSNFCFPETTTSCVAGQFPSARSINDYNDYSEDSGTVRRSSLYIPVDRR